MKIGKHKSMHISFGFIEVLWFALGRQENESLEKPQSVTKPDIRIGIPQVDFAVYDGCNHITNSSWR
jgi:hypothetical protein